MRPTTVLASVVSPNGGKLVLTRRADDYVIRIDGILLMTSTNYASEAELGRRSIARIDAAKPVVLIGGLGMGYTLRATLDALPSTARVDMVELLQPIIDWNRGPLAALAHEPLADPRVKLTCADVLVHAQAQRARYDAIILDVDNGPDALTTNSNRALYTRHGLATFHAALRPGGVLAIWSAFPSKTFTAWLEQAGFVPTMEAMQSAKGGPRHYLWFAHKPHPPTPAAARRPTSAPRTGRPGPRR